MTPSNPRAAALSRPTPWYGHLYLQVLGAIALGAALGCFAPGWGRELKPLGEAFVDLVKMLVAPIVFGTVVVGIARVGDLREVGRVGLKALIYFEGVSTLALVLGLVVVNVVQPGSGINKDVRTITAADVQKVQEYKEKANAQTVGGFVRHLIPDSVVGAFARGDILQVLLFSVLFGVALTRLGDEAKPIVDGLDRLTHALFATIGLIMRAAPVGAFGAMAFTVATFGAGSLTSLGKLLLCVYATCLLFVALILGTIARLAGFRIIHFLRFIREEILLVLGTSSSESALPRLMAKLETLGCDRSVVGLVVPTGYSFNLDGTSIYLTLAAVFVAQATNTPLTLGQQLGILAVLLLTSKGAAAVTGGGFITLAATLETTQTIPVAGLALILGVDRFMSEARAITNLIGNGVATIVIARWDGALDRDRLRQALDGPGDLTTSHPETKPTGDESKAIADIRRGGLDSGPPGG